jgi:putative transposase
MFFAIELSTRRISIVGITPGPNEAWVMQAGRNLTDVVDGFLVGKQFLILDRDAKFSSAFRDLLKEAGTEVVRLPPRSPNLNAFAERFVLSIKKECLNRLIESDRRETLTSSTIECVKRLGGMLRFYHHAAG